MDPIFHVSYLKAIITAILVKLQDQQDHQNLDLAVEAHLDLESAQLVYLKHLAVLEAADHLQVVEIVEYLY